MWPELDAQRARAALSQALYFLRGELGKDVVVGRGREEIGVDPGLLWCDVMERLVHPRRTTHAALPLRS